MKKTQLPFAFFQRESPELQESKGVLAVTPILTSSGPAPLCSVPAPRARGDSSSLLLLFPKFLEQ